MLVIDAPTPVDSVVPLIVGDDKVSRINMLEYHEVIGMELAMGSDAFSAVVSIIEFVDITKFDALAWTFLLRNVESTSIKVAISCFLSV